MRLVDLDKNNPVFVQQAIDFAKRVKEAYPQVRIFSTTELNEPDLDVDLTFLGITNDDIRQVWKDTDTYVYIDMDESVYRGVYAEAFVELTDSDIAVLEEVVL